MRTIRTAKKRVAFLRVLEEGQSVAAACDKAAVGRTAAYAWRKDDEEFAAAWDAAIETGTDMLEDEAVRRALDKSDVLLIFMLKARRPGKFKERAETTHKGRVTFVIDLGGGKAEA